MSFLTLTAIALRLLNPNDVAIDATLRCGEELRPAHLAARELQDVAGCEGAEALMPLVSVQTFADDDEREWQQGPVTQACGTEPPPMAVPLFACRNGVAAAYVAAVEGAIYTWTANGAVITAGAETNRVTVQLGDAPVATLTCVITTAECTQSATGVIAVREPVVVKSFTVPAVADANKPLPISWTYEPGREPASQVLAGDLFPEPVSLPADARSYTLTPESAGKRTIELRASYSRVMTAAPKRRRRAMSGGAAASECAAAAVSREVEVRGCVSKKPSIDAPETIPAGETFEAKIADLLDGEKVEWTVDNGTITSVAGKRVVVVAGSSGRTEVRARVERAAGCFALGTASVSIIQPLGSCPAPPSATLTLLAVKCDRAVVRATFTGTGPFEGRWSDGKTFRATGALLDHEFRGNGPYGVGDFHDRSCFGIVSGSPSATLAQPTVQLKGVEGCAGGQLTATFTGTPPFGGLWSDGVAFTTQTSTISRSVGDGEWFVKDVHDAICTTAIANSNTVTFSPAPRATVYPRDVCYIPAIPASFPNFFTLRTDGGKPPYVYEFTDGFVSTSNVLEHPVSRPSTAEHQSWELARVTANGCEAVLVNRFVTIHRRTPVLLEPGPLTACTLTNVLIAPPSQPSIDARIQWELFRESTVDPDAEIVSGQNTPQLTIRARHAGRVKVRVESRWEGYCFYDSEKIVDFVACDGGTSDPDGK